VCLLITLPKTEFGKYFDFQHPRGMMKHHYIRILFSFATKVGKFALLPPQKLIDGVKNFQSDFFS